MSCISSRSRCEGVRNFFGVASPLCASCTRSYIVLSSGQSLNTADAREWKVYAAALVSPAAARRSFISAARGAL